MSDSHAHPHPHDHDDHAPIHDTGVDNPYARRIEAIEALLIEKGIVTREVLRRAQHELASKSPTDGARLIARAWVDPAFKEHLKADVKAAAAELGIDASSYAEIAAVENTEAVHHVVVCTLCSCYPRSLLGLPPDWYKSLAYRSRAVSNPRGVLHEFGTAIADDVEVRVVDSTADLRYLVIPRRPAGTEGLSEAELAALVTRDSLIGVTEALQPTGATAEGAQTYRS